MRACVVLGDLGAVPVRRERVLQQLTSITGAPGPAEIWFVGLRQTRPLDGGTPMCRPYVTTDRYTRTRVSNALLRAVDGRLAPMCVARAALGLSAPEMTEAVLACNPDLVLLDARWGPAAKRILEAELPGAVYCRGELPANRPVRHQGVVEETSPGLVTIVLPTYNGGRYIRQSIASCLEQSYRELEVIVVDDGSREDIGAAVAAFHDARLVYVRHDVNRGLPAALNTGFRRARGRFLTWTSDDNYYAPHAIGELVRCLQRHPTIAFVYSSMYILDEVGQADRARIRHALPPEDLKYQNSIGACFLYRREVYEAIGDYDANATLVEDYDYWLRVSKRFRMQRLMAPLYHYRLHRESLTFKHGRDDVASRAEAVKQQNGFA